MSLRLPSKIKPVFFTGSAPLAHLPAILFGGYFLSPEFTVYPYLVSRGFLPYTNLLDQHFPALLFGPFSLPAFLTGNPYPLLVVFLFTTLATDLFFYFSLLRLRVSSPGFWLVTWITVSYWFSGNTLWLETFISLFLAIALFLSQSSRPLSKFATGFLFGLILLTKPTLAPALFFLALFLQFPLSFPLLTGLLSPLLVTGVFLARFGLVSAFKYFVFDFNRHFYVPLAAKAPQLRQILESGLALGVPILLLLRKKLILPALVIASGLLLAFPRFEYVHLQPALLLTLFFLAQFAHPKVDEKRLLPVLIFVFAFAFAKNYRHRYANFYLDAETIKIAAILKARPETSLYVFGGSDLLYPLTGRIPPGFTYLPSLPWYWQDQTLAKKMVAALDASFTTQVVVKSDASLDGANILESGGVIGDFIKENYALLTASGNYQIYQRVFK